MFRIKWQNTNSQISTLHLNYSWRITWQWPRDHVSRRHCQLLGYDSCHGNRNCLLIVIYLFYCQCVNNLFRNGKNREYAEYNNNYWYTTGDTDWRKNEAHRIPCEKVKLLQVLFEKTFVSITCRISDRKCRKSQLYYIQTIRCWRNFKKRWRNICKCKLSNYLRKFLNW